MYLTLQTIPNVIVRACEESYYAETRWEATVCLMMESKAATQPERLWHTLGDPFDRQDVSHPEFPAQSRGTRGISATRHTYLAANLK